MLALPTAQVAAERAAANAARAQRLGILRAIIKKYGSNETSTHATVPSGPAYDAIRADLLALGYTCRRADGDDIVVDWAQPGPDTSDGKIPHFRPATETHSMSTETGLYYAEQLVKRQVQRAISAGNSNIEITAEFHSELKQSLEGLGYAVTYTDLAPEDAGADDGKLGDSGKSGKSGGEIGGKSTRATGKYAIVLPQPQA